MIFDWWKHRCTWRGWFIGSSVYLLIDQSSKHRNRFKNEYEICMRCVNTSQTEVLSLQSRAAQVSSSCSLASVTDTSQTCSETQDRTAASLCILTVLTNLKQVPPVTLLIYWRVCDLGQKSNIRRISNQNQCKTLHSSLRCLVAHKVRWRCSRCHCILMLLFFWVRPDEATGHIHNIVEREKHQNWSYE